MAKSKTPKAPRSRPESTTALSQPLVESGRADITAFSPDAAFLAHLSRAVDRHRLRVYDADAGGAAGLVVDYLLPESLACHALAWVALDRADGDVGAVPKKRKAHVKAATSQPAGAAQVHHHVALGLVNGTVLVYSPQQAKVVRMLVASAPDITAAAITSLSYCAAQSRVWGVTANGWVHGWDLGGAASAQDRVPPALSFLPGGRSPTRIVQGEAADRLLTGHHAIALYGEDSDPPTQLMQYSGHASPLTHLVWVGADGFVSAAADDRHMYYWPAPRDAAKSSRPADARAMITLDAPARHVHAWVAPADGVAYVLVVTERGAARLYRLPPLPPAPAQGLTPVPVAADVRVAGAARDAGLVDAQFFAAVGQSEERIRFARLVKGVKAVLEDVALRDAETGEIHAVLTLQASAGVGRRDDANAAVQRYKDTTGAAAARAELPAHTAAMSSLVGAAGGRLPADAGDADAHGQLLEDAGDMVDEPTLAQRLKALKVQRGERAGGEGSDADDGAPAVSGASLASSLTQALHSGDHALLTACLVHSDPGLIRTTVRRISGPLAVRLLEACVDRLNRGGVRSKGALGSARARGIVEWIHQAMTCHTAYLMSLPSLVARLAQLHHSIAARLATYERLLALKGRLELVMSQIDMNMAYAADEAPLQVQGQKLGKRANAAEVGRRQESARARKEGQTWTEPADDEEEDDDVEEVGLDARDDDEGDEGGGGVGWGGMGGAEADVRDVMLDEDMEDAGEEDEEEGEGEEEEDDDDDDDDDEGDEEEEEEGDEEEEEEGEAGEGDGAEKGEEGDSDEDDDDSDEDSDEGYDINDDSDASDDEDAGEQDLVDADSDMDE
ncbi:Small subunit (SSU) processome component [Malassezia sp. CBS 17886]|nr:Small subunit (SSU) processome component [Malassezia sp. CBS 17886]